MSYISKHPVINMDSENSTSVAILDGSTFTGNTTELGFEKIYYFNNGLLTKWIKREDLSEICKKPVIYLPVNVEKKEFNEILFNDSVKKIENIEKEINEKNDNYIIELIMDSFEKHSEDISETIIELSDWKDDENVKTALNTLNLINHTLKDFVEKN